MWKIKEFKTQEERDSWIAKNIGSYQIVIIFLNNSYGVEYRPFKIINIL